jgi:hypothetical protein
MFVVLTYDLIVLKIVIKLISLLHLSLLTLLSSALVDYNTAVTTLATLQNVMEDKQSDNQNLTNACAYANN